MTVLIGIDLGERRIGVATADTSTGSVRPLLTLRRGTPAQDAASIGRLCTERGAERVVVGLPLNMDGSESEQSGQTRQWAQAVAPLLDLPPAPTALAPSALLLLIAVLAIRRAS